MAKKFVASTPEFTPMTYDEIVKPLSEMTTQLRDEEDKMEEFGTSAMAIGQYLNSSSAPIASGVYSRFMQGLSDMTDDLMRTGDINRGYSNLINLKHTYSSAITPIQTAIATRQADMKKYDKEYSSSKGTLISNWSPYESSIDDYYINPNYGNTLKTISGADLASQVADVAKAISKADMGMTLGDLSGLLASDFGGNWDNIIYQYAVSIGNTGLDMNTLFTYPILLDPDSEESTTLFNYIALGVLERSGITDWSFPDEASYNKAVSNAMGYMHDAWFNALGEAKVHQFDNKDYGFIKDLLLKSVVPGKSNDDVLVNYSVWEEGANPAVSLTSISDENNRASVSIDDYTKISTNYNSILDNGKDDNNPYGISFVKEGNDYILARERVLSYDEYKNMMDRYCAENNITMTEKQIQKAYELNPVGDNPDYAYIFNLVMKYDPNYLKDHEHDVSSGKYHYYEFSKDYVDKLINNSIKDKVAQFKVNTEIRLNYSPSSVPLNSIRRNLLGNVMNSISDINNLLYSKKKVSDKNIKQAYKEVQNDKNFFYNTDNAWVFTIDKDGGLERERLKNAQVVALGNGNVNSITYSPKYNAFAFTVEGYGGSTSKDLNEFGSKALSTIYVNADALISSTSDSEIKLALETVKSFYKSGAANNDDNESVEKELSINNHDDALKYDTSIRTLMYLIAKSNESTPQGMTSTTTRKGVDSQIDANLAANSYLFDQQ